MLLVVAAVSAWTGEDEPEATPGNDVVNVAATATPTPPPVTATATATASATSSPTAVPTATPTPYDGGVARLRIPRFDVNSAIEAIGMKAGTNQLDVPADPHNTGWYDIYDRPGWDGNAVFSAHVDYFPNIRGPFYNLASMELDDEVVIVMDNDEQYTYQVISKQRYTVSDIPMGDILWPDNRPEGEEWITLITCGGEFRATSPSGAGEYLHRDVVVARRVAE